MIIGRAAPLVEGLTHFVDSTNPEVIEANRIAARVLRGVASGRMEWDVAAGPIGIFNTAHDPSIYEAAAERLLDAGLLVEVHRFKERKAFGVPPYTAASTVEQDRVVVKSVDGEAVRRERIPQTERNHVARIYPPEVY